MPRSSALVASPSQQQIGLGILRVVIGIVFAAHGAQKLFTYGLAGITEGFAKMGVPMPGVMAPFISILEFAGGIALVIGLLTRLIGLGLAFDMLGAILLVHGAGGFFLPKGYEFVLLLLVGSAALAIGGPGAFSVDRALASRRDSTRSIR